MFPPETVFLVVDDMPTMRELVKAQLNSLGYFEILEAEDGEKALNKFLEAQNGAKPVGVIISDWNMPHVSGLDFLKQIRGNPQFQNIPFILLTSESEKEQVTEAVINGVSQYIVKPFQPKTLEEKLRFVWLKHSKKPK
ncbi:MAG: response regulator [Bdellovibrionaceae bacterium]|nr:response regulator [Pseudobdellovibrionaceae bacterium]MDW8189715.1 response regulator [Pseudobdellovibrionaceae bacterium]